MDRWRVCYYCGTLSLEAVRRCRTCGTRLTVLDQIPLWRRLRRWWDRRL
jgi:hypothetical protein